MAEPVRQTVRARVRAEMLSEIKNAARQRLAADGANLSLRAVARDVGLVSSAVYRYYASRDELLTALILDAYRDLGDQAEAAEDAVNAADLPGRLLALTRATRQWARAHPAEYGLLYGTPVPGYQAPQETVEQAIRVPLRLSGLLRDAVGAGLAPIESTDLPPVIRVDMEQVLAVIGLDGVPPAAMAQGIMAWVELFGLISFELFGHLQGSVTDYDAFFDFQMTTLGQRLGLSR
jgi:AcrR family transcriptional regulator